MVHTKMRMVLESVFIHYLLLLQVPFAYHDGYLSVHFEANKYQDIQLTPLQEEAVW